MWPSARYGRETRREHRLNATEQGAAVAWNITHPEAPRSFDPLPYFWSEQYDVRLQGYGDFPADGEFRIVMGSVEAGSFVATVEADGVVTGLVGWNAARELVRHRPLLEPTPAPHVRPDTCQVDQREQRRTMK